MRSMSWNKIIIISVSVFFCFTLMNAQNAQGNFSTRNRGVRSVSPVYIEGYLIYNSSIDRIDSYILVKRGNKRGGVMNNARVLVKGTSLGINRNGAFTGSVKASGRRRTLGGIRYRENRNNLNLSIFLGRQKIATISDNIAFVRSMRVVPVYRTGIDVGETVTVFWDTSTRKRNNAELTVLNANNGFLILKRIMRSGQYIIPAKTLPPRKEVLFRVRMFEKSLILNGNIAPGSYVNLYSGGEFRVNTHR